MEEELIIEIIEPIRFAQFASLTAYNAVNVAIVQYKDQLTGGEYSRTETSYEYNPTPEAHADGFFYMPAEPALIAANLFEGVTLLDSVPVVEIDQSEQQ